MSTIQSEGGTVVVEVRWNIGVVCYTLLEAGVLLTGTSTFTVRDDDSGYLVLLRQSDQLDGRNPREVVRLLSLQIPS